jgi:hypothetical protein
MKIFKNNVYLAFLTGGWLWENKAFCWLQLINIIRDSLEMFKMQEIYRALPGYDTEKSVRIRWHHKQRIF